MFPFFGNGRIQPSVHLMTGFWSHTALHESSRMSLNSSDFHASGGTSSSPAAFPFFSFFNTGVSSSKVKFPSLIWSSWSLIVSTGLSYATRALPMRFWGVLVHWKLSISILMWCSCRWLHLLSATPWNTAYQQLSERSCLFASAHCCVVWGYIFLLDLSGLFWSW